MKINNTVKSLLFITGMVTHTVYGAEVAPANDIKANATVLNDKDNWCSAAATYTTVDATGTISSSCDASIYNDIWFTFQTETDYVRIDLEQVGIDYARLILQDSLGNEVACTNGGNSGTVSLEFMQLQADEWYYLSVGHNYSSAGYQGTFTLCITDQKPPDHKNEAILLAQKDHWCSGTDEYTNVGATGNSNSTCEVNIYDDVWFKFQAATNFMTIDLQPGSIGPSSMTLEDEQGNEIDCGLSIDREDLNQNEWYYLRVGNKLALFVDIKGTFALCVNDQPPPDYKEGAIELAQKDNWCSAAAAYTNEGATGSVGSMCGMIFEDVWFKFQANTPYIDINLTGNSMVLADMKLENSQGAEMGCGMDRIQLFDLDQGQWYYLRVGRSDNFFSDQGTFSLCINDQITYDYFEGAELLGDVTNYCSGQGEFSTEMTEGEGIKPSGWASGPYNNVWFRFQAPSTGVQIHLNTGGQEGTLGYGKIALFDSTRQEVASVGHKAGEFSDISLDVNGLTPGDWYYIAIDNGLSAEGTFTLCTRTWYDYYDTPYILQNVTNYCSGLAEFSNATATVDGQASSCGTPYNNVWFKFLAQSDYISLDIKTGADEGTIASPEVVLWDTLGNAIVCQNAGGGGGDVAIESFEVITGSEYYFSVHTESSSANDEGTFTVCVTDQAPYDFVLGDIGVGELQLGVTTAVTFPISESFQIPVAYYISTSNVLDGQEIALGTTQTGVNTNVIVNHNLAAGNYFLIVVLDPDNTFTEQDETNNTTAYPIVIQAPDFAVSSMDIYDTFYPGQTMDIELLPADITGSGMQKDILCKVWFSADNQVSQNDILVEEFSHATSDNTSHHIAYQSLANTTPGVYYIIIEIDPDQALYEIDKTNNTVVHALDMMEVDLELGLFTPPILDHQGNGALLAFFDSQWEGHTYSASPTVSELFLFAKYANPLGTLPGLSMDVLIEDNNNNQWVHTLSDITFAAGVGNQSINWFVPIANLPLGEYEMTMILDPGNALHETNEQNNSVTVPMHIAWPDLYITPENPEFQYDFNTRNFVFDSHISTVLGTMPDNVEVEYYMSTSANFDNQAILMNATLLPYPDYEASWTVPGNLEGDYHIYAVVDPQNQHTESDENNNTYYLGQTYVGRADLQFTMSECNTFLHNGGMVKKEVTITEARFGELVNVKLDYFLSDDNILDAQADMVLGSTHFDTDTLSEFVLEIPAHVMEGEYTLFYRIDGDDQVDEQDETNNIISCAVTVQPWLDFEPEVTLNTVPDLVVPGQQYNGIAVTVHETWFDGNRNNTPLGIYLSTNPSYDDEVDLPVYVGEVTSNVEENLSINIPQDIYGGNFYLVFMADPGDQYDEKKETNNSMAKRIIVSGFENLQETPLNHITNLVLDQDETVISSSRSYFDLAGKLLQSQSKSFASGLLTISEPLYDMYGRQAGSTLSAPVNLNDHVYYPVFNLDEGNTKYDHTNFDGARTTSPDPVGKEVMSTLGWYYSIHNYLEPYTPTTAYPYNRIEYYSDGSGEVKRGASVGDEMRMGMQHETLNGTFPVVGELNHYKTVRDKFFPNSPDYTFMHNAYQQVTIDGNGQWYITLFDKDGKTLMSAMPGSWLPLQIDQAYYENAQRYFYVMDDQQGVVNSWNNSTLQNIVDEVEIAASQGNNVFLQAGFYKYSATDPDQEGTMANISTQNSFGDISYNIYNSAGRLVASIAPNGVKELIDNGLQNYTADDLPYTTYYEYNHQGRLLSMDEPDAGRTEYLYRKDGSIRYSQNELQRSTGDFSYTEYDALGRPIESGWHDYVANAWQFDDNTMTASLETVGQEQSWNAARRKEWVRTHYDLPDPNLAGKPFNNNEYVQDFVMGAVSWTENENSRTWYSYDEFGRTTFTAQQLLSTGTVDITYLVVTYQYDYTGNVTQTGYKVYNTYGNLVDEAYHYYTYDADQRLHKAYFSTWGNVQDLATDDNASIQATYEYYLHGPIKRVVLGDNIQGIDYTYTIHGALKSINHPGTNNDPGGDDNDVFGMLLEYYENDYLSAQQPTAYRNSDEGFTPQYNGNIAAMSWRTNPVFGVDDSGYKGTYLFDYDTKSQLTAATLASPTFQEATYGYNLPNDNPGMVNISGYDPNGNILGLARKGLNGAGLHNFTYHYTTGTNQLNNVDGHVQQYTYDALGRLTHELGEDDSEKDISYDVTGKVTMVRDENNDILGRYQYDERGFRIKNTSETADKITWYMRDISGNILMAYSKAESDVQAVKPKLDEVPIYGAGKIGTLYANDFGSTGYEVTDHLGNVRAVVTRKNTMYMATMEPDNYGTESQLFDNYLTTRVQEPFEGINHTPTSNIVKYVSRLYSTPNLRVGPVKVLQVSPGDQVALETYVKYLQAENAVSTGTTVGNIFEQVVAAFGGINGGSGSEQNLYDLFQVNFGGALAIAAPNSDFDNEPRAYLNYLFFDENGVYQYGGYAGMTNAAKIPYQNGVPDPEGIPHEKLALDLDIYEPGYVYIYVANESDEMATVFFDDLSIAHSQTITSQTTDYYAFGSILRRAQTNGDKQYRFGYQGEYSEEDQETGWNHFELREYDPVIGRWMVPDPYNEFWSPYVAMGNNPVNVVDPNGGCTGDCPPEVQSIGYQSLYSFGDFNSTYEDAVLLSGMHATPLNMVMIFGDRWGIMDRISYYLENSGGGIEYYNKGAGGQPLYQIRGGHASYGIDDVHENLINFGKGPGKKGTKGQYHPQGANGASKAKKVLEEFKFGLDALSKTKADGVLKSKLTPKPDTIKLRVKGWDRHGKPYTEIIVINNGDSTKVKIPYNQGN